MVAIGHARPVAAEQRRPDAGRLGRHHEKRMVPKRIRHQLLHIGELRIGPVDLLVVLHLGGVGAGRGPPIGELGVGEPGRQTGDRLLVDQIGDIKQHSGLSPQNFRSCVSSRAAIIVNFLKH